MHRKFLPGQPHKGRRGPGSWSRIHHTQIPYLGRCGILFAASIHPQPRRGMWSSQRLCAHHDFSLRSSLLRYRSEWTSKISSPSSNAMLNLSTPWVDSVPLGFDSPASSPGDSTEIANGEENRGGNWGPSDFTDIFRRPLHRRQVQDLPNSLDVELAKQLDGHLCYHRSSFLKR